MREIEGPPHPACYSRFRGSLEPPSKTSIQVRQRLTHPTTWGRTFLRPAPIPQVRLIQSLKPVRPEPVEGHARRHPSPHSHCPSPHNNHPSPNQPFPPQTRLSRPEHVFPAKAGISRPSRRQPTKPPRHLTHSTTKGRKIFRPFPAPSLSFSRKRESRPPPPPNNQPFTSAKFPRINSSGDVPIYQYLLPLYE